MQVWRDLPKKSSYGTKRRTKEERMCDFQKQPARVFFFSPCKKETLVISNAAMWSKGPSEDQPMDQHSRLTSAVDKSGL